MRIVEGSERPGLLSLQRGGYPPAQAEALDALTHDVLEPAIAYGATGAVFLADEIDEQRSHFVALVPIRDHGDPDAQIEALQPALGARDGDGEIVRGPRFKQAMRNFARTGVLQDLGKRHDPWLAHVA